MLLAACADADDECPLDTSPMQYAQIGFTGMTDCQGLAERVSNPLVQKLGRHS